MARGYAPDAVAGAILAGGKASRLRGMAKGALGTADGLSIVERLIRELAGAGIEDVVVVANDPRPYAGCGKEIIADIRTGIGPLGGIETAMTHFAGRTRAVAFLPCDLPRITTAEISALKEAFLASEARVVYAEAGGFFCHPLCAVVHNETREDISAAISRGERSVRIVWTKLNAVPVRFDAEDAFFNINTPSDLDEWLTPRERLK